MTFHQKKKKKGKKGGNKRKRKVYKYDETQKILRLEVRENRCKQSGVNRKKKKGITELILKWEEVMGKAFNHRIENISEKRRENMFNKMSLSVQLNNKNGFWVECTSYKINVILLFFVHQMKRRINFDKGSSVYTKMVFWWFFRIIYKWSILIDWKNFTLIFL